MSCDEDSRLLIHFDGWVGGVVQRLLIADGDVRRWTMVWEDSILFDRRLLPWPLGGNLDDAAAPAPCRLVVACCLVLCWTNPVGLS